MEANLCSIRNKLGRGEQLSTNDLRSLEPLHDADYYDDVGRIVGNHCEEQRDHFSLKYLDRALLDRQNEEGRQGKSPRLVRYVGMVQDMLDPEYYESYDSRGRSRHFGDHFPQAIDNPNGDDSDKDSSMNATDSGAEHSFQRSGLSESLAERIPLVMVPIPFASEWIYRGIRERTSNHDNPEPVSSQTSAVVSPVSINRGDRKRERDDDDICGVGGDCGMGGDNTALSSTNENRTPTQQTKQTRTANDGKSIKKASDIAGKGSENESEIDLSNSTNSSDWWPAGTCGTSATECPVLAKMCYDQLRLGDDVQEGESEQEKESKDHNPLQKSTRKTKRSELKGSLMLNDVVSMVGVLSMDPFEADFSGQRPSPMFSTNQSGGFRDELSYFGDESMMMDTTVVPPPSRLPRMYVLSYRRLELDDLVQRAIHVTNEWSHDKVSHGEEIVHSADLSDSDDDGEVEWSGFPMDESLVPAGLTSMLQDRLSSTFKVSQSTPWIRALWICLLSEGDRRRSNPDDAAMRSEMVRAGPGERALGCVSLRLATPDVASAKALFHRLGERFLPEICPVVAALDLTTMTGATVNGVSFFPTKDSRGRLNPCPLQLPKGSVLLVLCTSSLTQNNNNNNNNRNQDTTMRDGSETHTTEDGEIIETVLKQMVQHHKLPYKFEGGVMIPFEADYRMIFVTTQTQEFPCTVSALTGTGLSGVMIEELSPPQVATCSTKQELREALSIGRSLIRNEESLIFSSAVLERAQKDFLERRQRCHMSSASSTLPGEDDFHRWLTLAKLQMKNRGSRACSDKTDAAVAVVMEGENRQHTVHTVSSGKCWEPTVEDWEAALKLDDDVHNTV